MGQRRFGCKVMLWPWPSRKRPKCCARHVISIWWSFLLNSCTIWLPITKLWTGHDCDLDLQCIDPNVVRDTLSHYGDHFCKIVLKSNIKNKLWKGHDFAARSCCDLDLQGSDPNLARDKSSQYGDHFCKIVLKSNIKKQVMERTRFCCKVMLWPWPSR